jgi:hypothetical protein
LPSLPSLASVSLVNVIIDLEIMTGKEKIKTVVDIISEEHERIVTGNVVEISSSTFASKGLTVDDQLKVLDVLTNDKRIRYTFPYFSSRKVETIADRLKPDLIRLMPKGVRPKQSEEPFVYTIEVLDSFGVENTPKTTGNDALPSDKIKYQLTYNPSARELWLNDVLLANPQFGSENDLFLKFFVVNNNTGEHKIEEVLAFMKKPKFTKRPSQILGDVRITKEVKKVFFPNATVKAIEFYNPITYTFVKENKLPEIDMELLRQTVRISQK